MRARSMAEGYHSKHLLQLPPVLIIKGTAATELYISQSCSSFPGSLLTGYRPATATSSVSQPIPSLSASKRCGSGGRTRKRRNGIWAQLRSGGGGGSAARLALGGWSG